VRVTLASFPALKLRTSVLVPSLKVVTTVVEPSLFSMVLVFTDTLGSTVGDGAIVAVGVVVVGEDAGLQAIKTSPPIITNANVNVFLMIPSLKFIFCGLSLGVLPGKYMTGKFLGMFSDVRNTNIRLKITATRKPDGG